MQFYQRMKEVRTDADLTQSQQADILRITQQQYQLYESGKRHIPVELLKEFCLHMGVSADYILGLPKGLEWLR